MSEGEASEMDEETRPKLKLLPREDLREKKGIKYSRAQLWRKERDGTFPRRVVLSTYKVAWYEHEIDAWIAALPRAEGPNHE